MDIKITIEAPGLVQAIENLAAALASQSFAPVGVPVGQTKKAETKKTETKKEETVKQEESKEPVVVEETVLEEPVEETKEDDAPEITLVTVRSYLQKLQDAGRQKDAKAILVNLGHKKLSDVPEEEYPVLIAKVEELLA